jgi:hypothetical protein
MDYKFLDKVVDQIVRETRIDYDKERLHTPSLLPFSSFSSPLFLRRFPPLSFIIHCGEVYGLNKEEVGYVWKEYRKIIKDKINNEK